MFERLVELTSPGALAEWEARSDAIEHLAVVTQMLHGVAQTAADIHPQAFDAFLNEAVGNTALMEADVEREISEAT